MKPVPTLLRGLTWAALIDWLVGRTLLRSAVYMPKSPALIVVFQMLSTVAQFAATLTSLLALVVLLWIAREEWHQRRKIILPLALIGCAACSLFFLFAEPTAEALIFQHVLSLTVIAALIVRLAAARNRQVWPLSLIAFALLVGELYQLIPAIYQAMHWPGPPAVTEPLFNLGELLVVASPIGLWWVYRRLIDRRWLYVAALIPAVALSIGYIIDPATTGIMAIWSVGLTLYLPWPIYAVSLWLASVTVIATARRHQTAGWAVLLLTAGGFAPQLSTQVFLGLIAIWLLTVQALELEPSPAGKSKQVVPANGDYDPRGLRDTFSN